MTRPAALVVDASALLATVLPEAHTAEVRSRLASATELHAPDLLLFETTAVLAARVVRGTLTSAQGRAALSVARELPAVITPARDLDERAFALAERLQHSAYDCFYLALALERDCPLLTADRDLAAAACREGLGSYVLALGHG